MKKLIFGLGFLTLAYISFIYLGHMQSKFTKAELDSMNDNYSNQILLNKLHTELNKVNSLNDIGLIGKELQDLNQVDKIKLEPYVILKRASLLFNQGEQYLRRAGEIEFALTAPPESKKVMPAAEGDPENPIEVMPPPEQQRTYHPLTMETLEKAISYYEQAKKEADKLSEGSDADFNYSLNYLKGEIYYRFLQFLSDAENAQELFNQTLGHYKVALRYRPGDINTVVNIELLIKNQSSLLSNANNPQVKQKQMLNLRKAGLGSSKGN